MSCHIMSVLPARLPRPPNPCPCPYPYPNPSPLTSTERIGCELDRNSVIEFEALLGEKFLAGELEIEQRAHGEAILKQCGVETELLTGSDKYYCNFSIFQSLPDVWGLGQVFPIVPLMRLSEEPNRKVRLHDLTCDSDGQISKYAIDGSLQDDMLLHHLKDNEDMYLLATCLVGAYQEVLGDMHNLFGDTHAINVESTHSGEILITELEVGDCANEMLNNIHLDGRQIIARCEKRLSLIDSGSGLTDGILEEINSALFGYTYLDSIDRPAYRIKG